MSFIYIRYDVDKREFRNFSITRPLKNIQYAGERAHIHIIIIITIIIRDEFMWIHERLINFIQCYHKVQKSHIDRKIHFAHFTDYFTLALKYIITRNTVIVIIKFITIVIYLSLSESA